MQAYFQLSGCQFRAEEGDVLQVPLQKIDVGGSFDIEDILLLKNDDITMIGTPTVPGARVQAELLANFQDDKVRVFKFKRRTKYRKTQGHRQVYSEIKIRKIISPN
jgi:large subunit ribosomal protein L21